MGRQGFWDIEVRPAKTEAKEVVAESVKSTGAMGDLSSDSDADREKPRKSQAGRNPTDVLLLFKMLVLQKLYNISDDELEYQVNDRLSFMQFLGLGLEDAVPDATTVWLFREQLQQHDLVEELFEQFGAYLQGVGYAAKDGQIVDATLIPVPKQRNTREENQTH
jgi:IS5 family transposase